jgi:uncharacterized protein YbdZ (MbtH family)
MRAPGLFAIIRHSCHWMVRRTDEHQSVRRRQWQFSVLVNGEQQHSLWPAFVDVAAGWRVVYGEVDRAACLDRIEQNWTDIRPKSLRERPREALGSPLRLKGLLP